MNSNDLYSPPSPSISHETSCPLIKKCQQEEQDAWNAFNLLIDAASTVRPPHSKKTPTPEQVRKRKENARKHYEKNKEKRREQMKVYQRERRTNPAVRLLHNERERLRLRERREAERAAKNKKVEKEKCKTEICVEFDDVNAQVDEKLVAQMA